MQALGEGWKTVGRPFAHIAAKLWASRGLDRAIAITVEALVPSPRWLGVVLSYGVRVLVASRVATGRNRKGGAAEVLEDQQEGGSGRKQHGDEQQETAGVGGSVGMLNKPCRSPQQQQLPPARPAPKGLPPLDRRRGNGGQRSATNPIVAVTANAVPPSEGS